MVTVSDDTLIPVDEELQPQSGSFVKGSGHDQLNSPQDDSDHQYRVFRLPEEESKVSRLEVAGEPDDPLIPVDEELRMHGGSYLYGSGYDQRNWPQGQSGDDHYRVLRLPDCWSSPRPWTAFQKFLGADPINPRPGLKWFGEQGYQWEPRFVAYGSYELFGVALQEGDQRKDGFGHQLLVDLNLDLTGTERFHVQFRPLGRKNSGGSFWQLNNPQHYDDNSTLIPDRYWFEGELNSIFGGLFDDPYTPGDYHVVVGKFPFILQNGLLINDDIVGVAVNKNTILVPPLSNLNAQVFYAFDDVDSTHTPSPELFGANLIADYRNAFIEFTYARLHESGDSELDADYAAASATQFFGPVTVAGRALFKWADAAAHGDGQLFVLETNWTRQFSDRWECLTGIEESVFYADFFKATSGWSPISGGNFDRLRSQFEVNPLVAISSGRSPEETIGAALGVQLFRHHEDESIIPEVSYEAPSGTSVWGVGVKYLRKIGARTYLDARGVRTWCDDESLEREGFFVSTVVIF
ncbi:MAG: hypothetical protein HY000_12985 [Planctomycetes bacterium]|nr:hypothetical protein [Planctomycetota bacterium]